MDIKVSSLTGLINGYYDFDTGSIIKPFLTAGIGMSMIDADVNIVIDDPEFGGTFNESDDDTVIAYHLGAGVGFQVSENVMLDLRYRYFMTEDPLDLSYKSHNFTGGIRISF